jgi:hypothetical protein
MEPGKKEMVGFLILAIITVTVGKAWNELFNGLSVTYAENRNNEFLWIFIYVVILTAICIFIIVYLFPRFGLKVKT